MVRSLESCIPNKPRLLQPLYWTTHGGLMENYLCAAHKETILSSTNPSTDVLPAAMATNSSKIGKLATPHIN